MYKQQTHKQTHKILYCRFSIQGTKLEISLNLCFCTINQTICINSGKKSFFKHLAIHQSLTLFRIMSLTQCSVFQISYVQQCHVRSTNTLKEVIYTHIFASPIVCRKSVFHHKFLSRGKSVRHLPLPRSVSLKTIIPIYDVALGFSHMVQLNCSF